MKPILNLVDLIETQNHQVRIAQSIKPELPNKIPLLLSGGVGDVIMSIPFVNAFVDHLYGQGIPYADQEIEIYSRHPNAYNYFKNLTDTKALPVPVPLNYSYFLEVCTVVNFRNHSNSFLPSVISDLIEQQHFMFKEFPELRALVENYPFYDGSLARFAKNHFLNRRQFPFFTLGWPTTMDENNVVKAAKKYITVHDGFETASSSIVSERSTKQWNLYHWRSLVREIKRNFPEYEIIQLGSTTARPIPNVDRCLINKTTLTEAFDVLSESTLHIDGDSGLVHAATRMGVPCVVMFGPTPDYFYGYSENVNLRAETCIDACYWLRRDWLAQCPIGYETPQCMDDLQPEIVFEKVAALLKK